MTTEQILKGRKIIAEYMTNQSIGDAFGISYVFAKHPCSYIYGQATVHVEDLFYDHRWDYLLPVLLKISNDLDCHLVMAPGYAYFYCENSDIDLPEGFDTDSSDYYGYGDIQSIFQIVVDFLTFYNTLK